MVKQPNQCTDQEKRPVIPIEQAMDLSDEEWERLVKDEPRDFPKSYYLCQQDPEQFEGQDV